MLQCRHALLFEDIGGDYNIPMAANAKTVRDFDEGLTRGKYLCTWNLLSLCILRWQYIVCWSHYMLYLAVSFGFKSVDDYYSNSSSSDSIKDVCIPLLCIQVNNSVMLQKEPFLSSYIFLSVWSFGFSVRLISWYR